MVRFVILIGNGLAGSSGQYGVHMASTPEGMGGNRHATAEAKLSRKSTGYETAANDGQQEQP
jgi:hypothetical protein